MTFHESVRLATRVGASEISAGAFNAVFPAHRIVKVTPLLIGGRRLVSEPTEARGDPEAPLTMGQLREKYHTLAA